MKSQRTAGVLYIFWLIVTALLVFAVIEKQSATFYMAQRWVCCAVFVFSATVSFRMARPLWVFVFAALAVLFNPIFVLPLERGVWIVADWLTIAAMMVAALVFRKNAQT